MLRSRKTQRHLRGSRWLLAAACLAFPAIAQPLPASAPAALGIRLRIVEDCAATTAGMEHDCRSPHRRAARHDLPEQLRRLSPTPPAVPTGAPLPAAGHAEVVTF